MGPVTESYAHALRWSEAGDPIADVRAALARVLEIQPRRLISIEARRRLMLEWFDAHDHASHHVHGYFNGPDGEWVEHSPEVKERIASEIHRSQARHWRKRYREILCELRGAA